MFERDHIMRQVNQLAQALARAMSLRAENQHVEAASLIDAAIGEVAGVDVLGLSSSDMRELLSQDDCPIRGYETEIADLLRERAELFDSAGSDNEARRCRMLSLQLYQDAIKFGDRAVPWDVQRTITTLEQRLAE